SMASKCPVVTTDIEVFKELLEDGRCGSIYKSGNVRDAVDTINKILDDRVLRDAITDSAYTKVLERFTVEKVSLKWEKLLKSLE
ncbi:MAG: glycosyltransferase, partial [Nitrospirae bacterium]|nr:glycosyltransferase [Nitrospirota bacterium]